MALTLPKIEDVWSNPVVVRDLRMRLRGARAFWSQAFYLGILVLIALGGYLTASGVNRGIVIDPVAAQSRLQTFYYFIFETLAGLITLIAPALTAVAIVSERQRLTLDLLVASPLTSMKMLTGKLISSIAFLLLLLVMSIPASALCVILGGATVADVLRIYFLLAVDGVVLAAIGLAFSCTAKQNLQAIVGTYGAIILLYVVCAPLSAMTAGSMFGSGLVGGVPVVPGISALAMLCPFIAVAAPNVSVDIGSVPIPLWVATAAFAVIFVRIVLTAAALRLGMYGPGLVGSLRRQILFTVALALYLIGGAIAQISGSPEATTNFVAIVLISSIAFFVGLFFLATLFVPTVDEDGPAGQVVRGGYNARAMFNGSHDGSLPFFHLLLFVAIAAVSIGIASPHAAVSAFGMPAHPTPGYSKLSPTDGILIAAGCSLFYLSGLGFLMWSLARRVASFVGSAVAARPVTFLIFLFLAVAPFAAITVIESAASSWIQWDHMWLSHIWLVYPPVEMLASTRNYAGPGMHWKDFLLTGGLGYVLGTIAYPFWKSVTPAYGIRELRGAAAKEAA